MWLRVYLAVYAVLVGAAVVALWRGGVLSRVPGAWVVVAVGVAAVLGALLALVSLGRPPRTRA